MMRALGGTAAWAAAVLLLAPASAFAGSQLFKCVDGGRTIYQQQACSVSEPEAPASAAKADAARKVRQASVPASAAPATPR
jgi:uncharacterized iron-regulated membrane protein